MQRAEDHELEMVFLGTSGCIRFPAFFCDCVNCRRAREHVKAHRTRAGLAVVGTETVLVDVSPDLALQLDREGIRRVDRIFITHWHWDHVGGLGELGEPSSIQRWQRIDLYATSDVVAHFDEELAYLKPRFRIQRIKPGDQIDLTDAVWEVVKTEHTQESVGFIIHAERTAAYLVDGVVPPPETVERVAECNLLILEATLDELDESEWTNFSVDRAVSFWKETEIPECILTHLSCHSWKSGTLVGGWSTEQRAQYERDHPGLRFAAEGMRLSMLEG